MTDEDYELIWSIFHTALVACRRQVIVNADAILLLLNVKEYLKKQYYDELSERTIQQTLWD
jgi:hypothetical protein